MAQYTSQSPTQIPADAVADISARSGTQDDRNHNITVNLPKKTRGGSTGTATFSGGILISSTQPT
jgi:hypothetical protein